jgi:pimeloyl-ACP methyl ester carboxylesterase
MTYLLIPGAGCTPWHWHPLTEELERRGHEVIPVDLPCDDPAAGLSTYVDTVVNSYFELADEPGELVVVAHSLGGMTAPLVCDQLPVDLLVFVAGMIPTPGERLREWWSNTEYEWKDGDADAFFHDLPVEFAAEARRQLRVQAEGMLDDPSPMEIWPDVPTRAIIGRDDRLFPPAFLRRVTEQRLGFAPDEMAGAHFPMLGHAVELADLLETYRHEVQAA